MSKNNLEEYAYKTIINRIIGNHYKPGDFLLETELADSLKLSRTPIRHALGQLVAEGFLDKKRKKGCYIPVPSPVDAKNVFHIRKHLEGLAAVNAARQATEEDIAYLKELIAQEKNALDLDFQDAKTANAGINEKIHLGIAKISKNPYIEQYCRHSYWRSHIYIFFFDSDYLGVETAKVRQTPGQHLKIVKAIEDRDETLAGSLMQEHIQSTFEKLFTRI